jgi:hypothetical protein
MRRSITLAIAALVLGMVSVGHAAPTKHEQLVIFSETDSVPANSYYTLKAESKRHSLTSPSVQSLAIISGSCSLSTDEENDMPHVQAANSSLGVGLYTAGGIYIAESYLGWQKSSMGPLSVVPYAPMMPLTFWGGITAVAQQPYLLDLADFTGTPKPGEWTVGLDADVWNDDSMAHKVDSYCVLVVDEVY